MLYYFLYHIVVEPPEMIESQELSYADRDYRVGNLEMPEPILTGGEQSPRSREKTDSLGEGEKEEARATGTGGILTSIM